MEDKEKHFAGNVAQKAIIEKDGKILVCKGIGDTVWEFPGGRLHDGEKPVEGLAREIREELALDILQVRPVHVCRSYHSRSEKWNVFIAYHCTVDSVSLNASADEVQEHRWISRAELKELPMFDDCREAVHAFLEDF